jgi:hypothetical protein
MFRIPATIAFGLPAGPLLPTTGNLLLESRLFHPAGREDERSALSLLTDPRQYKNRPKLPTPLALFQLSTAHVFGPFRSFEPSRVNSKIKVSKDTVSG